MYDQMKKSILLLVLLVALAQSAGAAVRPSAAMAVEARRVLDPSRPVTLASVHGHFAVYSQPVGGFAVISSDVEKPASWPILLTENSTSRMATRASTGGWVQ